jgi:hypothetical protein
MFGESQLGLGMEVAAVIDQALLGLRIDPRQIVL